ncbi:fibrinogen C domain-containing protein 1-like [Amphibalanus amphitrite]|uniref:fibrinogen C domain-containing protein 1-like n=1 Tax=Amphibalanus amphitrite TaxID=1232801 RepID=UPI001C9002E3|nr:fibrinogen C domain-containing protein 1-like [Amphibalanus amphitrite]
MEMAPRLQVAVCVLWILMCTAGSVSELTYGLTSGTNGTSQQDSTVRDCSDLPYGSPSGVYTIHPDRLTPTSAYCDMDDGKGWTVFQKRADILPRQDFFKDWEAYKWGLGSFDGEFWWGLHHLWQLTSQLDRVYELRVDLWDFENQTAYAIYQKFTIESEDGDYRIDFGDYIGTAGDRFGLTYNKGMKFSTFDRDNEPTSSNCSYLYQGAWWYSNCVWANLNGQYKPGVTGLTTVFWYDWRGYYSLNTTTMKIRPTNTL